MKVIKVVLIKPKRTGYFIARWVDPKSGRRRERSTGTKVKREAERFALSLEKELQDGTYFEEKFISWKDARERYETEVLPGLAPNTHQK